MASSESRRFAVSETSRLVVIGALTLAVTGAAYYAARHRGWLASNAPVASDNLASSGSDSSSHVAVIPVEGMSCGACAARIKGTLEDIDGVEDVAVSLIERNVRVRHAPDKVTSDQLASVINSLGYKASVPAAVGENGQ